MKYIHPMEISSKIMTLIDLAQEGLVIVSPYVNFKKWDKMKACLKRAIDRGVNIEFYIRDNAETDLGQFAELNIKPIRKENLHAKLYYNERYGIVTSQNMIRYSDDYSIDIGYETETAEELDQLKDFKSRYLEVKQTPAAIQIQKDEIKAQSTAKIEVKNFTGLSSAIMQLTEAQAEEVYNSLRNTYSASNFTLLPKYVFSDDLLASADAMIGTSLLLKFPHDNDFCRFLKNLDLDRLNNKFRKQVDTSGKMHTYVAFTPAIAITLSELVQAYHSLISEIKKYVNPFSGKEVMVDEKFDWNKYLYTQLRDSLSKRIKIYSKEDRLNIYNSPDQYTAFIADIGKTKMLRLSSTLTPKEVTYFHRNKATKQNPNNELILELGYDNVLWGTFNQPLTTNLLATIDGVEGKKVADAIIEYVTSVTALKKHCN